jgi:carbonic anhydrase
MEIVMRIPALSALLLASAALCAAQSGANWTYEGKTGPLVWGKLDPAYRACSKGHEQSPLDIRGAHLDKSVRYQLVEIDFHHPSEHPVKGKLSDLEVDLVHRSEDGKLAIVAVRLNQDRGFPNATLATLWAHLPTKPGATEKVTDMVSAGGLLPGDPGYWTYVGSEVTPPCAEGVRWFVFEEVLSISREQFRAFANLFKMNTRPVQDAHGRRIEANE